jgi:hypothetical protein
VSNPKKLPAPIESLIEIYEKNPIARFVLQTIPGISAWDSAFVATVVKLNEKRQRAFFEALPQTELTEEQKSSEPFIHAFLKTTSAVQNTQNLEKVRLFANLFANGFIHSSHTPSSEEVGKYEEFLSILDDLSVREFQILSILQRHERNNPIADNQNELQRAMGFWEQFLKDVETEVGVPKEQIRGMLARLNRTGLYETFVGTAWGYKGDKGSLTSNFYEFIQIVNMQAKKSSKKDF